MHTNTKYQGTQDEKDEKALEDIKAYLNDPTTWDKVVAITASMLTNPVSNEDSMRFAFSFIGIQGYPIGALRRYVTRLLVGGGQL